MGKTREFRITEVASALTGMLLCPIGDLYGILSYMVGRSVFTHEIPEACRLAGPAIIEQHPALDGLDLSHVTRENWRDEAAILEARFGATLALRPLGWNRIADADPVDTLIELVGEERVIVVDPSTPEEGAKG